MANVASPPPSTPPPQYEEVNPPTEKVDSEKAKRVLYEIRLTQEQATSFAQMLLDKRNKEQLNLFCRKCDLLYSPERMPYSLVCGHSHCQACINTYPSRYCNRCEVDREDTAPTEPPTFNINLDLYTNVLVIYETIEQAKRQLKGSSEKGLSRDDFVLASLQGILETSHDGIGLLKELDQAFADKIKGISKTLEKVTEVGRHVRELMKDLSILDPKIDIPTILGQTKRFIDSLIKQSNNMDEIFFATIADIRVNEDLVMGIETTEIEFTKETLESLALYNYNCFAMKRESVPPKFSEVVIKEDFVTAACFEDYCNFKQKDVFVIDYQRLHINLEPMGVFFHILPKNGTTVILEARICASLLYTKQLFILCMGDRISTYKGGKGLITSKSIVFKTYLGLGNLQCTNDVISGVPDRVGKKEPPKRGVIWASKMFGKETEMTISREDENDVQDCIGSLNMLPPLAMLPEGEFTIQKCGVMYRIPASREATKTLFEGDEKKKESPKIPERPRKRS